MLSDLIMIGSEASSTLTLPHGTSKQLKSTSLLDARVLSCSALALLHNTNTRLCSTLGHASACV
eukprot:2941161-Rhodomonas_salina.2